jgi:hypothetical protein
MPNLLPCPNLETTLQTHIKSPAPSIGESEKDRVRVTAHVCTMAAAKVQDANARTRETTFKTQSKASLYSLTGYMYADERITFGAGRVCR